LILFVPQLIEFEKTVITPVLSAANKTCRQAKQKTGDK
jgi:hypothetical protein